MNEKERLESIEEKIKVLISLVDDTGSGEANLLAIANDMRWLISLVKKKANPVTVIRQSDGIERRGTDS